MNRKIPPVFSQLEKIKIIEASLFNLDNGVPVHYINAGSQDIVKIDLIFPAGNWYEHKRLAAYVCNSMLNEGTVHNTAKQIAEKFDYYGCLLDLSTEPDHAIITLTSLVKHLNNVLGTLKEIITQPVFPSKELLTLKKNNKQRLNINNQKVDFVARKLLTEKLFGAEHPYGFFPTTKDYDKLKREDLVELKNRCYNYKNCKIIASGKINKYILNLLNECFGKDRWGKNVNLKNTEYPTPAVVPEKYYVKKKNANQSAIRIGKVLFNKTHPDYNKLLVLNTVLGGYFGSRLMKNIREDKGYTYGIGSSLTSFNNAGYFYITTETGVDVCKKTINEIYKEINILQNVLIPQKELAMVRSYMLGYFLASIDGPFALAAKFRSIMQYGLGYNYYYNLIETIKTITPQQLKDLCNKYFIADNMHQVVVGKI